MIIKRKEGYYITSEGTQKQVDGPYKTRDDLARRLRQIQALLDCKSCYAYVFIS